MEKEVGTIVTLFKGRLRKIFRMLNGGQASGLRLPYLASRCRCQMEIAKTIIAPA